MNDNELEKSLVSEHKLIYNIELKDGDKNYEKKIYDVIKKKRIYVKFN